MACNEVTAGEVVIKERLKRALDVYEKQGWVQLGLKLCNRLGFVAYNRALLFLHLELGRVPTDGVDCSGLIISTKEEVQNESDYDDGWSRQANAMDRLRRGYRLFRVAENGKWIYFQWVETKEVAIPYFDMCLRLPDDMVYLTHVHTAHELRGRGIAYRFNLQIIHRLKEEGYRRAVIVIDPSNTASIRLARKVGFREYQIVHYRRVWFVKYYRTVKYGEHRQRRYFRIAKPPTGVWRAFL